MNGIPLWLIKLSIITNTITCGPTGYSLCARFYEREMEGCVVHAILRRLADRLFWWDENHCRKAWTLRSHN
jgi:hypothetical protein